MSRVAVATLDELGDVPLGVEMPEADLELALVRIGDEVFAIRDECSHGKVRLSEGDVDISNCAIECYLHGSMFDLRTGAAINLPQAELTAQTLAAALQGLTRDKLLDMAVKARALARPRAAQRVADELEALAGKGKA